MSWSRDGNIGVPFGKRRLGRWENGPAGVEAQAVVAAAPRRRHALGLVDDERSYAAVLQSHGCCDPAGPAPTTTTWRSLIQPTLTPPATAVRACP